MRDFAIADLEFVHKLQATKSNELCRQFLKGGCSYGPKCKYTHDIKTNFPPFYRPTPFESAAPSPWPLYDPSNLSVHFSETSQAYNCTNNAHYPATKLVSPSSLEWRTTPCRHFSRNKGWCPLGDDCNFIHDLHLQRPSPVTEIQYQHHNPSNLDGTGNCELDLPAGSCTVNSSRCFPLSSHCWTHVQSRCRVRECRYFHPQDVRPYLKYTPCPGWLTCPIPLSCPFKHPEAMYLLVMPSSNLVPVHQLIRIEPRALTPSDMLPMEVDGTTYYPVNTAVSTSHLTPIDHGDLNGQMPCLSTVPGLDVDIGLHTPSDVPTWNHMSCELEAIPYPMTTGDLDLETRFSDASEFYNRVPNPHRPGHARWYQVAFKSKSSINANVSGGT